MIDALTPASRLTAAKAAARLRAACVAMAPARPPRLVLSGAVSAALLGLASPQAAASGFALIENSAASLGTAYSGVAASAEDASTIWFNPAGMTYLPLRQMAVAGHLVRPSMKFSDRGSQAPAGQPLGSNGGDAGGLAFIPNTYATHALSDRLRLGFAVNVPFGLKTQYDDGWIGRYQALKSEVRTINLNPAIAWRVSDKVSLGAGFSIQRADATLTNASNAGIVDNKAKVKARDTNTGFNLGVIVELTPDTRIGAAYRSSVGHKLEGSVAITDAAGASVGGGPIASDLRLPASFSLSSFTRMDDRWDLLLDASWTGWSSFERLVIQRTDTLGVVTNQLQDWRDTWRFSAGANYRWRPDLMLRAGIAYDQAPMSDATRNARVPDGSRTWLTVGARYSVNRRISVDAGYAHLRVSDPSVSDLRGTGAGQSGNLVGKYSNNINILSAQLNYSF